MPTGQRLDYSMLIGRNNVIDRGRQRARREGPAPIESMHVTFSKWQINGPQSGPRQHRPRARNQVFVRCVSFPCSNTFSVVVVSRGFVADIARAINLGQKPYGGRERKPLLTVNVMTLSVPRATHLRQYFTYAVVEGRQNAVFRSHTENTRGREL